MSELASVYWKLQKICQLQTTSYITGCKLRPVLSSTIGIVFLPFNLIVITALILYTDSSQFQMYPLKSFG